MNIFTTELLSATAPGVGNPPPLGTALSSTWVSGFDVVVNSLSAGAIGLAFNKLTLTTQTSTLNTATLGTNAFKIAVAYHGTQFGVIHPNLATSLFTYNSASASQTITSTTSNVTYPNKKRKWLLGF